MYQLNYLGIGWGIIGLLYIIFISFYIVQSIGIMYMLKVFEYQYPIDAWVPYWRWQALTLIAQDENKNIDILGYDVPAPILGLWPYLVPFIHNSVTGSIVSVSIQVICLGRALQKIYAKMENKDENQTKTIGYVSAFFTWIMTYKFIKYRIAKQDWKED